MQKIYSSLAGAMAIFIVYIIYGANTGNSMSAVSFLWHVAYGDKLAHFMLFGFLSFLLNLALATKRYKIGRFWIYRGTMLVGIVALIEELSQRFIPARTFEYYDLLADFSGIAFFALLTAMYAKRRMVSRAKQHL